MFDTSSSSPVAAPHVSGGHVYVRTPEPVVFPAFEEMPGTNRHLEIRTALYLILKRELRSKATIGSDQFVYYDPTTPTKRLAPDAFVRLGKRHRPFRTWKIWERGAPDLAVEVVSKSDRRGPVWKKKLERYRASGIREVVRFNPRAIKQRVRVWDAVGGDLVERSSDDPRLLACEALGLWWVVVTDRAIGPMLRLARDPEGRDLLPTPDEVARKERAENRRLKAELAALKQQVAAGKSPT